jgi:hypothetical protein
LTPTVTISSGVIPPPRWSTHAKRTTGQSTSEEAIYGNAEEKRREIGRGRVREGKKHRDLPDRYLLLTRYPLRFSRFVAAVGEFQMDYSSTGSTLRSHSILLIRW